jgi:hypothetical protein
MKPLDEREYHLSNFHRDLMEAQSPAITEGYEFLQTALKQAERDLYDRQCEIRDYIRAHKLKATKKPEQIERERLRRANPPKPIDHDPQMAFPFVVTPPSKIAALIAAMNATRRADLPSEPE